MAAKLPARMVSKSKFSMYLRTLCDRELYLSLFSNNPAALSKAGIPVPLKSRPGVQLITSSGIEFEHEQYDILLSALPNYVVHSDNGKSNIDLIKALSGITTPSFILQPAFEPQEFRDAALSNLGVSPQNSKIIPALSGLRPDVIFAHDRGDTQFEILPDGSRARLADNDKRIALSVIDLKNITEANASYSAEVCLYAIFLSNWLHSIGKQYKELFFVSERIYLWRHVEMPRFTKMRSTKDGRDPTLRLLALMEDLKEGLVKPLIYMPSVRKFFSEDLPRVLSTGDAHGWSAVDYHVNSRCSSCDWLGNRLWLSTNDKKAFDAHPEHYCSRNAETTDHLSKMATLSKGASSVLAQGGHNKVANIVALKPDDAVLRGHSLLKKDRAQISARAQSIVTNQASVDQGTKLGGLARRTDAEYDLIVNFDAGSGFLTGIAVRGSLFAPYEKTFTLPDGKTPGIKVLGEAAFIVNKDALIAEWAALSAFLEKLGGWIEQADAAFKAFGLNGVRTQICFWEIRQYEELCNAFGRHLLRVLALPVRSQRALAWIFPPEELMEKSDHICPNIVFINDIVSGVVRLPQRFAITLLGTAEFYHHARLTPRSIDNYYLEPLGNSIPRERIFEIWKSTTGTVQIFGRAVSVAEAIQRFETALKAHTWALASITARLRDDLKNALVDGKAPRLSMSIPSGLTGAAFDSKLWDRWSTVSSSVEMTEGLSNLTARVEALEASYKAILLKKLIKDLGEFRYEFEVSEDSTEAKIEERDACTLGIVTQPGFPLQRAGDLGLDVDEKSLYLPTHSILVARIEQFNRVTRRIIVRLESSWYGVDDTFQKLMASEVIPIGTDELYLMERLPFDDSASVTSILKQIGDPAIASPAPEALTAMGAAPNKKIAKGTHALTAAARVLWQGDVLSQTIVRNDQEAQAVVKFAAKANKNPLNASQVSAVEACAKNKLAIVWGPPGTGKTETLVAYLHAVIREGKPRKILITGPNYRAVEELSGRLVENIDADAKASCDFFWLYSKAREPKQVEVAGDHWNFRTAIRDIDCPEYQELLDSLADERRITLVSTTAHIVDRLTKAVSNTTLAEVFHLVVLDESSQIPLTLALKPLAGLHSDGQLIVAGDHMQMPPIQALDPPKNAEYLVASIQNYLIARFKVPQQPLLINYRSNQDLVDYAKSLGYPVKLEARDKQKDLRPIVDVSVVVDALPAGLPKSAAYAELLRPDRRVTALIHDDPTSSQANEVEAGIVAGLAYVIRNAMSRDLNIGVDQPPVAFADDEFFKVGIGIVTPHKAQKALVIRKLRELFPNASPEGIFEAVDTVERFQGGERDTIIVSYGVGDTDIIDGEEAFLLQLERTNVAVSRAKAKCIVMMPKSLAYHLPTDQKAAETSVALKSYLEEFCNHGLKVEIEQDGKKRSAEVRWH
jgi:hypothetical protein